MNAIERLHSAYVQERRVRVLSAALARQLPPNARVLDVGAGDGWMARCIEQIRPDLHLRGLDVLVRENTFVPVCSFDGKQIPEPNASYDVVMFVDVLHHTKDPMVLLREACRVTRHTILIKDHNANGAFSYPLLRLMDRVGNSRYGVALPYNYWPEQRWREAFLSLRLTTDTWDKRIGLYPWPASLVFDRNLHFLTQQHKFNES